MQDDGRARRWIFGNDERGRSFFASVSSGESRGEISIIGSDREGKEGCKGRGSGRVGAGTKERAGGGADKRTRNRLVLGKPGGGWKKVKH